MPQAKPTYYEGQEFENPDDPNAPILVWTKKGGFMPKDRYVAQRGGDQVSFDRAVSMLDRLAQAQKMADKPGATGFLGRLSAGDAGGWFKGIGGSPGYNLDRKLLPVRGNNFVQTLNTMRQNSPTGGAVGNVTDKEGAKIESLDATLDVGQSREQLKQEIAAMQDALRGRFKGVTIDNPVDLSGGGSRAYTPKGAYYIDPEGNIRRNDNIDAGNPIFRRAKPAAPRQQTKTPTGASVSDW